ncbi:MAG: hypothetical protein HY718_18225 [Planctomycetes bacterium]|nr:hypothetical protein [Planctomycetota bacterium]
MSETLSDLLADLTGQEAAFQRDVDGAASKLLASSGLGYSQLNELLLLLGYDRVSREFFQYLVDGRSGYEPGAAFKSLDEMRTGVDRFRQLAILRFGNVKFGFKHLSAPSTDLAAEIALFAPVEEREFDGRHDPLMPIEEIPADQTYLLGYLIKRQLGERLEKNPSDEEAKRLLAERERIVEIGKKNHIAYLASDHMDVYVATSMRERHEYQMVNRVVRDVFSASQLKDLKLRWFDPTQACCSDRIDKGLAEGLMLKRAACTLYLAQESDTLGKDSELACTLAQGKPVIAYIPSVPQADALRYVEDLLNSIAQGSPSSAERVLVLQQLRVFSPEAAWQDREVMDWVRDPDTMDLTVGKQRLAECIRLHYDRRADTLKKSHPLGIQMHLEPGVANGVLVARTIDECAELIKRILTRTLEFKITEESIDGERYLLLKEALTDSVFRVVTGDRFLTNAFWNFYLAE